MNVFGCLPMLSRNTQTYTSKQASKPANKESQILCLWYASMSIQQFRQILLKKLSTVVPHLTIALLNEEIAIRLGFCYRFCDHKTLF